MKRILSWDIGINNLSYCLINANLDDAYNFTIEDWNIINIGNEQHICDTITPAKLNKKGEIKTPEKKCTLVSKYELNGVYYCNKHQKKEKVNDVALNDIESSPDFDKSNKYVCVHKIKDKQCNKKAVVFVDNLVSCYCKNHGTMAQKRKKEKDNLQKIAKKNSNRMELDELGLKLFEILDKMPHFLTVDEILLENQPSLINPRMKSIMMILYSYFLYKGMSVNKDPTSNIKCIKLIAPSNKLKVSDSASKKLKESKKKADELGTAKAKRETYILTKTMGIKFCIDIISNTQNKDSVVKINSMKKKDDMCDSFLQAFYYIYCKKKIPDSIILLLKKYEITQNNDNQNAIQLDVN